MNETEQARFAQLYDQHLNALKLQGKRPRTVEAYARAVRRIAAHFDRCPDQLAAGELKAYFGALVDSHSWSTVKVDRNGVVLALTLDCSSPPCSCRTASPVKYWSGEVA